MNTRNINAISLESLRHIVPAAFSESPADFVSPDYKFVKTSDLIEFLISAGWVPFKARQQGSRDGSRIDVTKHQISFRPKNLQMVDSLKLGGIFPTVDITNSHNWTSIIKVSAGCYRIVCGNGLAIIMAMFFAASARHDSALEDIQTILGRFRSVMAGFLDQAYRWADIELDELQRMQFAMEVAKVRFPEPTEDHARTLLIPHRIEDASNSLWHTFNTIQENAIHGGNRYGTLKRSVRSLTNIDLRNKVNEAATRTALLFDPASS